MQSRFQILFEVGAWSCEKIEGVPIFVFHRIFMTKFFEVFLEGTWVAPSFFVVNLHEGGKDKKIWP